MILNSRPPRAYRPHLTALLLLLSSGACLWISSCSGNKGTNPNNYPPPTIIELPEVSEITASSAQITWTTDVEATTTLRYGLQSGQYTLKDSSKTSSKKHTVNLVQLSSYATYYFVAQSKSSGGFVRSDEGFFRTTMASADMEPAAWALYGQGKAREAIALFGSLLKIEPLSFRALTGLGWCYADAGIDSLGKAQSYFSSAISLRSIHTDALAGRGFVGLALKSYSQAATDFSKVLTINPAYAFAYNSKVTAKSIRLGLAEAQFYLQLFSDVQSQIDLLAPGNGLNSDQAATWSVDGKAYATYQEALLGWIEKLKAQG